MTSPHPEIALGSEDLKREFLPRLARGEIDFCLGYTEPEAGSDLASLRTRAVAAGDDYVINGSKVYTSGADSSDYCWLLASTDPSAAKHQGLSLFIVPMNAPGVSVRPLMNLMNLGWFKEVVLEDVLVSRRGLVGAKNEGWQIDTAALSSERLALYHCRSQVRVFESLLEYAKRVERDGQPLSRQPLLRQKLTQLAIDFQVARLLTYRAAWLRGQGQPLSYESAMVKLFNTELSQPALPGGGGDPGPIRGSAAGFGAHRSSGDGKPWLSISCAGHDRSGDLRGTTGHHRPAGARPAAGLGQQF